MERFVSANSRPNTQANKFFRLLGKALWRIRQCAIHFTDRARNWRIEHIPVTLRGDARTLANDITL